MRDEQESVKKRRKRRKKRVTDDDTSQQLELTNNGDVSPKYVGASAVANQEDSASQFGPA
jgi:hypothetical protein